MRLNEITGTRRVSSSVRASQQACKASPPAHALRTIKRSTSGLPNRRARAKASAAPSIAPIQVTTVPHTCPNSMPLAMAISSAGNGTNESRTMSAIDATGAQAPQASAIRSIPSTERSSRATACSTLRQPKPSATQAATAAVITRTTRTDCRRARPGREGWPLRDRGMASVDGGDVPSEPATNGLPETPWLVRVRSPRVVHESIHVDDEVGRLELQTVEIRLPATLTVDDVRHHTVHLIAVLGPTEGVAETLRKFAGGVLGPVGSAGEQRPVDGIEPVRRSVVPHHLRRVVLRVRGDGDELHQLPHRCLVDHLLNLGDALGMQGTDVRAARVNEMQDHDLAAEVLQRHGTSLGVLERELGRFFADRLEVFLAVAELPLQLFERVCRQREDRCHDREQHKEDCFRSYHGSTSRLDHRSARRRRAPDPRSLDGAASSAVRLL